MVRRDTHGVVVLVDTEGLDGAVDDLKGHGWDHKLRNYSARAICQMERDVTYFGNTDLLECSLGLDFVNLKQILEIQCRSL